MLAFIGFRELLVIGVVFAAAVAGLVLAGRLRRVGARAAAPGGTRPLAAGPVGFAVLYRWRLVPGREDDFRIAWERLTMRIRKERGGLGSRLHCGKDGLWWAYAQWPNEERWRAAMAMDTVDAELSGRMGEAILERFDPVPLTPVADLLVREATVEAKPA